MTVVYFITVKLLLVYLHVVIVIVIYNKYIIVSSYVYCNYLPIYILYYSFC